MDFRIFTEPQQGASYDELLEVAQASERLGFDGFFRSDHYLTMGGDGLPGPTDAWVALAGIARETSTIRLGTLMTSATFRHPGPLAISVAQVDQMSGGRVELGIGAGWFTEEHTAYGIPFPDTIERFDRFSEQLAIITGLWATADEDTFSYEGKHYQLTDSPALPKPDQSPLPVIIGGMGKKRTPELAARYAAEFNVPFRPAEAAGTQISRVRQACEDQDRDPASMTYSTAQVVCVGKDDAEIERRAAAIGREVDELRTNGLTGTPDEVVEKIAAYAEAGITRVYFQILDLSDQDQLELIASDLVPPLQAS